MSLKNLLLLSVSFLSICLSGQYNQLLAKKYADKIIEINDFYGENINLSYPAAKEKYESLKLFGEKNKDISLQLEAELYLAYYKIHHRIGTEQEQVTAVIRVKNLGRNKGILDIEARALKVLRDHYWYDKENYELGFEYGLKLNTILEQTNAKDFPDLPEYYNDIASSYYLFRDYHSTIKYDKKTLSTSENSFNWKAIWSAANTIGLSYQKLNKTDSSNYYFRKAADSDFFDETSIYYTISMGNIGYNLYRQGNFTEAVPLLQNDISNAEKIEDFGLAVGSLIPLADIFIYQNKLSEAQKLLKTARLYIQKSGQTERKENLYPVLAHWFSAKGMNETAIKYKDSTVIAMNDNSNKFSGLMLLRVQQKIDAQKLETTRQKMIQSEKDYKLKTILFLVFLGIIIAFSLLYYSYIKKIFREKNRTKEAELKFSSEKLKNANQTIHNFLREIENKNRLIEQLQKIDDSAQNYSTIEEIKKTAILTEEDWKRFKEAFERINPGYVDRLKDKIHGITPAEIRIMVLSKLKLSHKEIAGILGISPQSSRVTWHRLKKKINLEDNISLEDLAGDI